MKLIKKFKVFELFFYSGVNYGRSNYFRFYPESNYLFSQYYGEWFAQSEVNILLNEWNISNTPKYTIEEVDQKVLDFILKKLRPKDEN